MVFWTAYGSYAEKLSDREADSVGDLRGDESWGTMVEYLIGQISTDFRKFLNENMKYFRTYQYLEMKYATWLEPILTSLSSVMDVRKDLKIFWDTEYAQMLKEKRAWSGIGANPDQGDDAKVEGIATMMYLNILDSMYRRLSQIKQDGVVVGPRKKSDAATMKLKEAALKAMERILIVKKHSSSFKIPITSIVVRNRDGKHRGCRDLDEPWKGEIRKELNPGSQVNVLWVALEPDEKHAFTKSLEAFSKRLEAAGVQAGGTIPAEIGGCKLEWVAIGHQHLGMAMQDRYKMDPDTHKNFEFATAEIVVGAAHSEMVHVGA